MKTKIGVLGSCVTRDAFNSSIVHNYKDFFKIEISAQRTSIISFMQDPIIINEKLIDITPDTKRNRAKTHCISYDLNKNFLKELIEKDIEYLIIDNFLEVRLGILYFETHIMTNNTWHLSKTEFYKTLHDKFVLKMSEFPDEYYLIWTKYVNIFFKFLEIYCPNIKIILNKGRYQDKVLKSNGTKYINTQITTKANIINPLLDKLDSFITDNYNVRTIEFDYENTYLDEEHIWGFAPVHYQKNYYYNLIETMKNFVQEDMLNKNKNNKNETFDENIKNIKKQNFKKELEQTKFETQLFLKHMKKGSTPNSLSFYNRARIDMKNCGVEENRIEIIESIIPIDHITFPKWFKNDEGQGIMIRSEKGTLDMRIKCINEGILKILLKSPDMRDKNSNRFPIYIDYTNFTVNNEKILKENVLVWHNAPYLFKKEVKDSEILDLHIEWTPFNESSVYKK